MDFFDYKNGELWCEGVKASAIAEAVGTPAYVYSRATIEHHYRQLGSAFAWAKPTICYSVKALSNLAVVKLLASMGAGFDVVSGGEIHRVLAAGGEVSKIVFAGVGKTDAEMELAAKAGIDLFTVESEPELDALEAVARELRKTLRVALRVNPGVDPKTHVYVSTGKRESKFGVDLERAGKILSRRASWPHLDFAGIHAHIGSQIVSVGPFVDALTLLAKFIADEEKAGLKLSVFDMGGGFGIFYKLREAPSAEEHAAAIRPILEPLVRSGRRILMEPGRFIAGQAGILLSRVTFVKDSGDKRFVIVDAAMNDLLRPALYHAEHQVWPVKASGRPELADESQLACADIVGPVCESGDFLARERPFPEVRRGDLIAVFAAGAYGMTMSSNYNSRPRAPEVLVEGNSFRVVRRRETFEDLTRLETT